MKKSIITGILFLAVVAISAQEKGHKNTKPIKNTKGTNSSVIVEKEIKTTTPVSIRPTGSNSTNRATQSTTVTNRPEATVEKGKGKVITNRATQSTNNTMRPEKPAILKEKEDKPTLNRAAQSTVVTDKPEKVKEEKPRKEKPSKKERKEK